MTTDPTIIKEDRAAAEEIEPPLQTEYPLEKIERDRRVAKNAAIIARHREQHEKVLVEALRFYADGDNYTRTPENEHISQIDVDDGDRAEQALKEAGYDQ